MNEDFVVARYSNRPFANTVAAFIDTLDGERVTRNVRMAPDAACDDEWMCSWDLPVDIRLKIR